MVVQGSLLMVRTQQKEINMGNVGIGGGDTRIQVKPFKPLILPEFNLDINLDSKPTGNPVLTGNPLIDCFGKKEQKLKKLDMYLNTNTMTSPFISEMWRNEIQNASECQAQ